MKTLKNKQQETIMPADAAFSESASHILGDLKLQPYTASRIVAAQAMGLKYPNVPKGFEQYAQTGSYPGLLRDVIVVLGACMMNDADIEKAQLDPDEAYLRAQRWADSKGIIHTGSKEFFAAKAMFEKIMVEIYNSRSEPKPRDGRGDGEHGDDEPGNE